MTRSAWFLVGAAIATVVGGVVVFSGGEHAATAAAAPPANTANVKQGRLSSMVSLDGTLTYRARSDGSPYSVINHARGIYTELPGVGDRIDCGDVLYRVDEEPVLLLCGAVPAYRDLRIGDDGKDVRQLNRNLHVYRDEDEFTWRTQAALERLQRDRGCAVNGELDLGDAAFLPRSVRIAKVSGGLGGSAVPGAPVAQATSGTLVVQVALDASQQGEVRQGDRARITLPGNRLVKGRVARLSRVAQTPDKQNAGDATIPAYISLDDPTRARGLDQAPVQVDITTRGVKSALSVPVTALVGKAGGGFAVEVVRAGGRRDLVAVKLGLFDTTEGRVQVEGGLREGDPVVVPSP